MKTISILIAALTGAGSALAAPTQEMYYNLVASAPGKAIDNQPLKPNAEFWYIGKAANSTCGDVAPAVTVTSTGHLGFYADGHQNQQYSYVDVSGGGKGLFGFTLPNEAAEQWDRVDVFTLAGSEENNIKLIYDKDGSNWLACPTDVASQYTIYPEKAYDRHAPTSDCISFEARAEKVETPKSVCVYN
ncbi:hypothetical protein DIS24_g12250 [Lasiodiplodia hormozganensis]|uniref:Uncharacterized protein n=1 Tax=Lasiodiplodia hormozganensis TaxID=869390 RepID=A0AA39TQX3_9PEZI|nr:hypothetical protein DIS24_g12250 [Lasiodiplodia hormozganensis]